MASKEMSNECDKVIKCNESNDELADEELNTDLYEALDPRVKEQLEKLNQWTDRINALEKKFEQLNGEFRCSLSESSDKLKQLSSKLGKVIEEARPYYDAKQKAQEAQFKCQKAAIQYEKACKLYEQAKETINLAEMKFASQETSSNDLTNSISSSSSLSSISAATTSTITSSTVSATAALANVQNDFRSDSISSTGSGVKIEFDCTWQEMLNQATLKLANAEQMRKESTLKHERCMQYFMRAEEIVHLLERQLKSSIKKSKIYFDEQKRFQEKLNMIKSNIECLSHEITESKYAYSMTLKSLETISEEIHEKRNKAFVKCLKREPGVGAEKVEMINEINNTINSESAKSDEKVNKFKTELKIITNDNEDDNVPQINVNSSLCQLQVTPKSLVVYDDDPSVGSSLNSTFQDISINEESSKNDSLQSDRKDITQDESFVDVNLE